MSSLSAAEYLDAVDETADDLLFGQIEQEMTVTDFGAAPSRTGRGQSSRISRFVPRLPENRDFIAELVDDAELSFEGYLIENFR
jgi:hypothetical protein